MKDISELMYALGYRIQSIETKYNKTRYRNEYTFIDIWLNKKNKTTVGIYNPKNKKVYFNKFYSLTELEKIINKQKQYEQNRIFKNSK